MFLGVFLEECDVDVKKLKQQTEIQLWYTRFP